MADFMGQLENWETWVVSQPFQVKVFLFIAAVAVAITIGLVAGNASYNHWARKEECRGQN